MNGTARVPRLPARVVPLLAACSAHGAMAMAASAARQPYPGLTHRAKRVLEHIEQHPITLQPVAMEYAARPVVQLPDVVQGLNPEDIVSGERQEPHHARVLLALLYLACGGLDQAHNLVTPLCWGAPTAYSGPPLCDSPAKQDAALVHALIHRQEGNMEGEFGSGFSNACYWYAAAGRHPIYPDVLQAAHAFAGEDARLQEVLSKHGSQWDTSKWVNLCARAQGDKDPALTQFCERVANAEWRLLFHSCHSKLLAG